MKTISGSSIQYLRQLKLSKLFDSTIFRIQSRKNKLLVSFIADEIQYLTEKRFWRLKASALFDGDYYTTRYQDLKNWEIAPIVHYMLHGFYEGRNPSYLIDMEYVLGQVTKSENESLVKNSTGLLRDYSGIRQLLDSTDCSPNALFDNDYFRTVNLFTSSDQLPIEYYVSNFGVHPENGEIMETTPLLSWRHYINKNADIKSSELSPLEHFIRFGFYEEKRMPDYLDDQFKSQIIRFNSLSAECSATDFFRVVRSGELVSGPKAASEYLNRSLPSLQIQTEIPNTKKIFIGTVLYKNEYEEIQKHHDSITREINSNPHLDVDYKYFVNDEENYAVYCKLLGKDQLLSSKSNIGFGSGHNRLMEHAFPSTDVYIGLNPDGFLLPGALNAVVSFDHYHSQSALIEIMSRPIEHPKWFDPITLETEWVSGAAFAISRDIWEEVNGFDENIFLYGEDVDLSWRAKASGFKLKVCPTAKFHHDVTHREQNRNEVEEKARRKALLCGANYLCKKWNGYELAEKIELMLRSEGLLSAREILDEPKERVPKKLSDEICDFNNNLTFSLSRFWA